MSEVKVTVGGAPEDEAAQRFIDAWHRAERGDDFHERHLAFESWDAGAMTSVSATDFQRNLAPIRTPPCGSR